MKTNVKSWQLRIVEANVAPILTISLGIYALATRYMLVFVLNSLLSSSALVKYFRYLRDNVIRGSENLAMTEASSGTTASYV